MDTFRGKVGQNSSAQGGQGTGGEPATDLASVFNYPSLGQLFDGADTRALEEMRARLARTTQDLERVVRQGPKEDAERAARAVRAVGVALQFLSDLEQLRREGGQK